MNMGVCVIFKLLQYFLGGRNLLHLTICIFGILAVEELVEVLHGWDRVKVVLFRWVTRHPLEAACTPWIKWSDFAVACSDEDVDQEKEDSYGENERTD